MEISYYSDAAHNYMVLECPPEIMDNYQYRMLAANQIRGLLPCSSRTIDSRDYLYYDISSRQSLSDLYDRRSVRGEDLQKILESLVHVQETLTEYLLDGAHLLLEPACIYADFREQTYSFTYYPGEEQKSGWEPLFSFLADRVEGRDKQAAGLIYRLCMMAERPGFHLCREVLGELGVSSGHRASPQFSAGPELRPLKTGTDQADLTVLPFSGGSGFPGRADAGPWIPAGPDLQGAVSPETGSPFPYVRPDMEYGGPDTGQSLYGNGDGYSRGTLEEAETDSRDVRSRSRGGKRRQEDSARGNNWKIILGVLMLSAGLLLFMLNQWVLLEERELLLSRALGGLMAAAGAALALAWLTGRKKKASGAQKGAAGKSAGETDRREQEWIHGEYAVDDYGGYYEQGRFSSMDISAMDRRPDPTGNDYYMQKEKRPFPGSMPSSSLVYPEGRAAGGSMPRASYGAAETTLLGRDSGTTSGLYGTGNYRGEQISLAELPCVVGKMREYVDQVLDDASVSRMHARFGVDEEGKMSVRDLNSTNGTWLNGERLQPNESRRVETGDHIRLGRVEFVYR